MNGRPLLVTTGVLCGIAFLLGGCRQTDDERILPGHTRPLLEHDWPHPRDYQFESSTFSPPDPVTARFETPNGFTGYVISDPTATLVRVTAAIPIGRLYERNGEAGASQALVHVLTNPTRGSPPLSLRLESLGASLDLLAGLEGLTLSLEVLSEDWEEALRLMVEVLRQPRFDPSRLRDFSTASGYVTPTSGVSGRGFRPKVELERQLVGYPLAPPEAGQSVSIESVRSLASRSLAPNLIVLGLGGNVPREESVALLNELTSGWEPGSRQPELRVVNSRDGTGNLESIDLDILEGWVAIGRVIGPVPREEWPALAVLGEILGTRLNIAVREIRGLANRASFFLPEAANGAGLLHIRTGGRPEAVAPLVKYCRDEMAALHSGERPVTAEELALAKGILRLGKWQAALDGSRLAAGAYAVAALHHGDTDRLLGWPEELEAVSIERVAAVAKHLDPNAMDTVIVGPIQRIREARHPRWPVDLDSLSSDSR